MKTETMIPGRGLPATYIKLSNRLQLECAEEVG